MTQSCAKNKTKKRKLSQPMSVFPKLFIVWLHFRHPPTSSSTSPRSSFHSHARCLHFIFMLLRLEKLIARPGWWLHCTAQLHFCHIELISTTQSNQSLNFFTIASVLSHTLNMLEEKPCNPRLSSFGRE